MAAEEEAAAARWCLPKVADARLSHMLPPRTLPGTRKGGQRSGSCSDAGSPATVRLPQHAGYSPCHGTPLTTLHRLTMPHPLPGDHANHLHGWDDLHPASPSRQIASIQLSGLSDYTAVGGRQPMRGVSPNAPCRVCFQPGKDVMVPGYPGVMDYPDDEGLPAFAYLFEVSE